MRCRGGDSRARRNAADSCWVTIKWQRSPICHCEEAKGRRGNPGKAAAISPIAFPRCGRVLRDCHVASLLAMTRQGSARCTSALLPLNIPYKAVTDRRYTPYFGVCRFHGRLYGSGVRSREGHAAPLQCTAGGLCIFHSSFFSLQYSFPCAPPLQCTAESLVQLSTSHFQFSTSIPLCPYT